METFYTCVHQIEFLRRARRPLLLSRHRFFGDDGSLRRRTLPRAAVRHALDSGGFNALRKHGRYLVSARQYAAEACRVAEECGSLDWCAAMDWVCEPFVRARTGRSVRYHQLRTVESLLELRSIAPGLPWVPVVQGWEEREYLECVALYLRNGVDLRAEPLVGVGSVCSRKGMGEAARIVRSLAELDLRLHVFGYSRRGLPDVLHYCASADSAAWSDHARRNNARLPGCAHRYRSDGAPLAADRYADPGCGGAHPPGRHGPRCAPSRRRGEPHHAAGEPSDCRNCLDYAEAWSDELVEMARAGAAPDAIARFWGLRPPSGEDVRRWLAEDPAEGQFPWERAAELRGDFEVALARVERMAGVEVGFEVSSHFVRAPGFPCADGAAAAPAAARDLPAAGEPLERFAPWAPPAPPGSTAARLPAPGRGPITPHAARLVGQRLAREAADAAGWWIDEEWLDAEGVWRSAAPAVEAALSAAPAALDVAARAEAEARSPAERARVLGALRDGALDGLWSIALAERPAWGLETRPDREASPEERARVRAGPPAPPEDVAFCRGLGAEHAALLRGVPRGGIVEALRAAGVGASTFRGAPWSRARADGVAAWREGLRAGGVRLSDPQVRSLLG